MTPKDERLIARNVEIYCGWLGDFLCKLDMIDAPWRRFTRDGTPPKEYVRYTERLRAMKIAAIRRWAMLQCCQKLNTMMAVLYMVDFGDWKLDAVVPYINRVIKRG